MVFHAGLHVPDAVPVAQSATSEHRGINMEIGPQIGSVCIFRVF